MIKKQLFYLCISLLVSSCSTYTTFYSTTHQEINIEKISKISRLDLSNQDLEELPISIESVKDLKMINLSNNIKLNIDSTFRKLAVHKNLEVLILDSLDIKEVPASIKLFPNLKQISLVHNPNLNLQQVITQISGLPIEFLNLKNNKLASLPENITKLQDLRDLNLSYNTMNDPLSYTYLGKLPKLYSLWIDHNELQKLPNTIGELSQIRFLYIDHNELKELPYQLTNMKKLWVVHAGYNQFKELPAVFTTLKSLLMVHINNNQIQHIPKVYETEKYPLAGLLLDNNPLLDIEIKKAKKIFSGFFLLSFEQKVYQ
ncbi:leucine-rich repeat domain-containing protein [uncultured Aquimarina sp.]|uniref:leucine-rich repeat domain-containing protein n=1 Tax=uncultured Aquimarina sp. TaxID=575652 RepID=UPI002610B8A2|nr:leucine-rich repeat domain-containing protein [uncultured Aquimarina sp.]